MNKQLNELNEKADKITAKLNPQQKLILAIITPIFLLILFIAIAKFVDAGGDTYSFYNYSNAFDFAHTWWVWLIYCFVVGLIEFKLFDKPKI
jgi:hypothetical protein